MKQKHLDRMTSPQVTFTPAPWFPNENNVDLWPKWTTKYYNINKVFEMENELVNAIIQSAPLSRTRKLILVDIRNQYLKVGFNTSGETSPGRWHVDTPSDPDALHHVYVIGENRTEFKIGSTVKTLPKNYYASYGFDAIHRGVEVHTEEFRLFVRIEEVNNANLERDRSTGFKDYFPVAYPVGNYPVDVCKEEYYNRFLEKSYLNPGVPRG